MVETAPADTVRSPDAATQRSTSWQLPASAWIVAAVGVVVRVGWALFAARPPKMLADPLLYYFAAVRIAEGEGYVGLTGYPTSYYPPGYPWFLGVYQWLLDAVGLGEHTVIAVALLQSLLGGVTILATFLIGRRVGGTAVGLVAGAALALWPNLVLHASIMLSETLFLTLVTVSVAALLTMDDADGITWWKAAIGGLAMGAATLVRPQVLLVAAAVVVAWALGRPGWKVLLRRTAVVAVGVLVVVTPWTIRNAIVFDAFVPVSTNGGDNLCIGFNPEATGHFGMPESCDTGEFYIDGPEAEIRRQNETQQRAIDWIIANPTEQPALAWKKLFYTFSSDRDAMWASMDFGSDQWIQGPLRGTLTAVSEAYYGVVMAFAIAGLVLVGRRGWRERGVDEAALVVFLAAVVSTLLPIAFFGDARFKVPGTPFYAILAASAAVAGYRWILARRSRPLDAPRAPDARRAPDAQPAIED